MRTDQSSTLHYGERFFHTVFASEREVPYNPILAEAARCSHDLRRQFDPTGAAATASVRTAPDAVPKEEYRDVRFRCHHRGVPGCQGRPKVVVVPRLIGAFIAEMDFGVTPAVRQSLQTIDDRDLYGYAPPISSPTSERRPRASVRSDSAGRSRSATSNRPVMCWLLSSACSPTSPRQTLRSCCRHRPICRSSTSLG